MPIYIYKNPKTKEIVEVFQSIKEKHEFFDEEGLKYERVFTVPFVSIDSKIDPYSSNDFLEKTRNKKGSIGDLIDKSKELSEARGGAENDPVLKKYLSSYEQEKGVKHSSEIKKTKTEKANKKLKKLGIKVEN